MSGSTVSSARRVGARLLVPLALLSALAPFATDLYLPAFPEMVTELDTSEAGVQLSLTTFLVGAGLGQVVFGPLSDRFGRLTPLHVGLLVSLLAGVLATAAPTITVLVCARLVQGFAAAAGMVIGRAMITDLTTGTGAARALSIMMVVGGVAPVLAPIAGAVLTAPAGWRGLLWIVAGLTAIAAVLALILLRETHPRQPGHGPPEPRTQARVAARAMMTPAYIGNTLTFALAFAAMMAYISASPFLYQDLEVLTELACHQRVSTCEGLLEFATVTDALGALTLTALLDLAGPQRAHLTRCQDGDCGWVFLDTTGRRHWCSTRCGTRARVRAHRARTAQPN